MQCVRKVTFIVSTRDDITTLIACHTTLYAWDRRESGRAVVVPRRQLATEEWWLPNALTPALKHLHPDHTSSWLVSVCDRRLPTFGAILIWPRTEGMRMAISSFSWFFFSFSYLFLIWESYISWFHPSADDLVLFMYCEFPRHETGNTVSTVPSTTPE